MATRGSRNFEAVSALFVLSWSSNPLRLLVGVRIVDVRIL